MLLPCGTLTGLEGPILDRLVDFPVLCPKAGALSVGLFVFWACFWPPLSLPPVCFHGKCHLYRVLGPCYGQGPVLRPNSAAQNKMEKKVELANSFWPRKLSAAPIGVFFKCKTLFKALVEHLIPRLQVVDEEETVGFPGRLLIQPVQLLLRQQGAELLNDGVQLLVAQPHPGADLRVPASDEEGVQGAVRLVQLRRVSKSSMTTSTWYSFFISNFLDASAG